MAKNRNVNIAALDNVLASVFEPLAAALDIDAKRGAASSDTGQDKRSETDMGVQVLVGQMIQLIHNQVYGQIEARDGRKFDNLSTRVNKSISDLNEQIAKYDGDQNGFEADPRALSVLYWHGVNHARLDAYTELMGALMSVYTRFTNQTWKPYVRMEAAKPQVEEATKSKIAALFSKKADGSFVQKSA